MKRAVFLDRDGVLNEVIVRGGKPFSPANLAELVIVSDAAVALTTLKQHRFWLTVVTNQPDIARGLAPISFVESINAHLRATLPIDAFEMCPHDDGDNCNCRKPKPGMLLRAAERDGIDLTNSFMIGDRWRDIEAGRRAGCHTILIGDGYSEKELRNPDANVSCLSEAADWILMTCGMSTDAGR